MSGFVQNGSTALAFISTTVTPTITGVGAGNTLISTIASTVQSNTFSAPTDSSGQTWNIAYQAGPGTGRGSVAIAYLLNANAGTHNLTWTTASGLMTSSISEWNGVTALSGSTGAEGDATSGTTLSTANYTPATANEVLISVMMEQGSSGADGISCSTAAFQSIGSGTDAASHSCTMINQNTNAAAVGEANATIVSSTAAINCSWAWTSSKGSVGIVMGFTYTPPHTQVVPWQQVGAMGCIVAQ
jgi:hypothetical protein